MRRQEARAEGLRPRALTTTALGEGGEPPALPSRMARRRHRRGARVSATRTDVLVVCAPVIGHAGEYARIVAETARHRRLAPSASRWRRTVRTAQPPRPV